MTDFIEELLEENTPIFANKDLLDIRHVPKDSDRIVGRDEELRFLVQAIRPALDAQTPTNIFLYGKSGTGKSLCSQFVSKNIARKADGKSISMGVAYVNCLVYDTETGSIRRACTELNEPEETGIKNPPESGISGAAYYETLYKILDDKYDVAIIILDEIDKLDEASDNVIAKLSRAGESQQLKDCRLSLIGISNQTQFKELLRNRTKSSVNVQEYVFSPYDANQLKEILSRRRDAFREGVIEDGIIDLVAAKAASQYGDARKAIELFRNTGEVAQRLGRDTITSDLIEPASNLTEANLLRSQIMNLQPHAEYVTLAIVNLALNKDSGEEHVFSSTEIIHTYEKVCGENGSSPMSKRRVRDILGELAELNVIEQRRPGQGRGKGRKMMNELLEDPDIVAAAIREKNADI